MTRHGWQIMVILLCMLVLVSAPFVGGDVSAEGQDRPVVLSVQSEPLIDSLVVDWETASNSQSHVLYGEAEDVLDNVAFDLLGATGGSQKHQAKLTGLRPGSVVYYVIVNNGMEERDASRRSFKAVLLPLTESTMALGATLVGSNKIGIDVGHGLSSGSPSCDGRLNERDNNRGVAEIVKRRLDAMGYAVTLYQGSEDSSSRNFLGAAFVALHNDYCYGTNSGFKVSRYGGRAVSGTKGTDDASDRLTLALWNRYRAVTGLPEDRGSGHFTLDMLWYPPLGRIHRDTPGAIIEMGWWSGDYDLLVNQRGLLAEGVVQAILSSLGKSDGDDARGISMGGTQRGTISPSADVDSYWFDGRAGQTVTLTMRRAGGSLDSWLEVYAPSGDLINSPRQDDDRGGGNGGRDAQTDRLSLTATGRYVIYAKSYGSSSTGEYALGLNADAGTIDCPDQYKAEYWSNRSFSGSPVLTRCEGWPIRFNWGGGSPGNGVPSDNFSARWTGRPRFEEGEYDFVVKADDGMRVWLDSDLVINAWRDQAPTEYRQRRRVSGGEHTLRIEYYENGGGAVAEFRFERATSAQPGRIQVVQALSLSSTSPRTGQNIRATFEIQNVGGQPVRIEELAAAARRGNDWNGTWCDFPHTGVIILNPGDRFSYSKERNFDGTGAHFAEPTMRLGSNWGSIERATRVSFAVDSNSGGGDSANLALNRAVSTTSNESSSYIGARGVDGNRSSRWSSAISSNLGRQWFIVDLGQERDLNQVIIRWENAYAAGYYVAWSSNGTNFEGFLQSQGERRDAMVPLGNRRARYVAIVMLTRAPRMNNYSLWEMEVYRVAGLSAEKTGMPMPIELFVDVAANASLPNAARE